MAGIYNLRMTNLKALMCLWGSTEGLTETKQTIITAVRGVKATVILLAVPLIDRLPLLVPGSTLLNTTLPVFLIPSLLRIVSRSTYGCTHSCTACHAHQ